MTKRSSRIKFSKEFLEKVKKFSADKTTPFLILSLKEITKNYEALKKNLREAKIYYAIKANPHPEILSVLCKKGSNFDVATIYELKKILKLGVRPEKISFGNTIKKSEDISFFYKKGVRLFVTDSPSDLKKIARAAPKSKVIFRLAVDGKGADWELSKKFGAHPEMIIELIVEAERYGLQPIGLSFHVGSQQRDVAQWDHALSQCKYIFDAVRKKGIHLKLINLGGGLPSNYLIPTPSINYYCKKIRTYLKNHFGKRQPELIIEPGRYIAGSAGIIVTEVILRSKKSESLPYEWLYIDAGIYQGMDECIEESLKYPIITEKRSKNTSKFVIAGPTCDSFDILYEEEKYSLPSHLREGSRLYFLNTGAYTYQISAVEFNSFPPLAVYILENKKSR